MGKGLAEAGRKADVSDIVHHGEKLILPEKMTIPSAIRLLKDRLAYLETEVSISRSFDVFPWDGAFAFNKAIADLYGWAKPVPTPGFFGSSPPELRTIEVDYNHKVEVPWGRMQLPNVSGWVATGMQKVRGRYKFSLSANVLRKDEADVRRLFDMVEEYVKEYSIYRGKAIKLRFRDANNELLDIPEPEFINTRAIDPDSLIYSRDLQRLIEANLFVPITRVHDCIKNNVKVKRGILLGGMYGTGKTLAATVASRLAVENGITYVYTPHSTELADAIEFAKQYQSPACVVFAEDIDRAVTGPRSVKLDDILNIIDGIDTKTANIITVLTTNHLENINRAMLRPGRLDAIIDVTPPDAEAVQRLVRMYAGQAVDEDADLTEVGETLAGNIPAVIEEVVKRAKLYELNHTEPGEMVKGISSDALLDAARTMDAQIQLLSEVGSNDQPMTMDQLVREAAISAVSDTDRRVREIHEKVTG